MRKVKKAAVSFISAALASVMLCAGASAATELVTNGKASNGLNGWTDPDKIWTTRTSYDTNVKAYDSYFFMPKNFKGKDGASTRIYQDISVKKYAGQSYEYSAYVRTWDTKNTDETLLRVDFYDANGKFIESASVTSSKDPSWHKISIKKTIPKNAATARLNLYAVYHYGSEVDSYFDNISFTVSGTSSSSSGSSVSVSSSDSMMILYLEDGDKLSLGALVGGKKASSVTYSSSAPSVAKVTSKGKVKALKEGTAVITAKSGSTTVKIQVVVTED